MCCENIHNTTLTKSGSYTAKILKPSCEAIHNTSKRYIGCFPEIQEGKITESKKRHSFDLKHTSNHSNINNNSIPITQPR
jgi:hypothetical protein